MCKQTTKFQTSLSREILIQFPINFALESFENSKQYTHSLNIPILKAKDAVAIEACQIKPQCHENSTVLQARHSKGRNCLQGKHLKMNEETEENL